MRVTLRRRQGDRKKFVRSRLDSTTMDYSRDEGLVEIVHVEINDEDTKPPRSAVTIAKNVAREARRAGFLKKTAEPGHVRTLRLRDWPDTCEGLGIPCINPTLPLARVQEPRREAKGGPLYEKPGACPACGGETVNAGLGSVRLGWLQELYVCKRACYSDERATEDATELTVGGQPVIVGIKGESSPGKPIPEALRGLVSGQEVTLERILQVIDQEAAKEAPTPELQAKLRALGASLQELQEEVDELQALLDPKGSTPKS